MTVTLNDYLLMLDQALSQGGAPYNNSGKPQLPTDLSMVSPDTTIGRVNAAIEASSTFQSELMNFFSQGGEFLFNSIKYGLSPSSGLGEIYPPGTKFPDGTVLSHSVICVNISGTNDISDQSPSTVSNPFSSLPKQASTAQLYDSSGLIAGVLAHELGHFSNYHGALVGENGLPLGYPSTTTYKANASPSIVAAAILLDEGAAIYNDFVIGEQVAVSTNGAGQITDLPFSPANESTFIGRSPALTELLAADTNALSLESEGDGGPNKTYLYNALVSAGLNTSEASKINSLSDRLRM